jgi:beta-lactamase class A
MSKDRLQRGILVALGCLVAGYGLMRIPHAIADAMALKRSVVAPSVDALIGVPSFGPSVQSPQNQTTHVPNDYPFQPLSALSSDFQSFLDDQGGTWGVFVIDLVTGQTAGQNSLTLFPAASTIKLPLALYIYDQVAAGKVSLDEQIAYTADDWEDGAGLLQWQIEPGETRTIDDLVNLAITQSDNVAKNMLMRRFGQENLFAWIEAHGGQVERREDGLIYTNAQTLAKMMRLLYTGQAFHNTRLQQKLLDTLTDTAFHDRSVTGVPSGVKVAHKIGNLEGVVNDVALVWAPHGPFILAALSDGVTDEQGNETISGLTAKAFTFFEEQHAAHTENS